MESQQKSSQKFDNFVVRSIVSKAETLWNLKIVASHIFAKSFNLIKDLFKTMFRDKSTENNSQLCKFVNTHSMIKDLELA